ncbi:hypothetical protein, conserved [Babesia bigemina]|uniref:Uncharacterized protein n=1 Tax=Babesia bigemina TaxID=5866 RepID=A0A061D532_BABBI|nr:hypothetical protein, conserved [Babesia bigemina]CDR94074.1 hypothetical protein, conserved [Babesia bigemina]|eukprot:XP_012766260.1 hypothetical protein, conserved [Babesia bigemina]
MRQTKCGLGRLAEAFFMGCCLLIGREYIMLLADNNADQGKTMYTVFKLITFLTIIAAGDPRCYLPSLITPSVVVQFICSFLVFGLSGGGTYTLIVQCLILALGAVMNTLLLLQAATEFSNNAATTLAFLCGCVFSYELADICNALPWFRRNMFMRLVLREFPSHALIQTKCAAMAAAITMRYALGEQCSFYSVDLWKFYKAHKNAFVEWRTHPLFGLILRERSKKMMPLYTCMAILIAIIGALPPHAQLFKLPLANYRLMYIAGFEEWALGAGVLMGAILPFPRSCKFMLHVTVLVMCLLNTLHVPIYMHFTSLSMLKPYTLTWFCIVTSFLEGYTLSYGIGQLVSVAFLRGCSGVLVSKSCCEAIADAQCFCKQKADNFECRGRYDPSRAGSPGAKQKSPSVSTNHIIWVKQCDNTYNMGRCFPLKCKCTPEPGASSQGKVQKTCIECTMCNKKDGDCKTKELIPVTCTKKIAAVDEKVTKAEENQQNKGGSGDSAGGAGGSSSSPTSPSTPTKSQAAVSLQQSQESLPKCTEAEGKGASASPKAGAAKAPAKEEKTKPDSEKATGVEAKDAAKKKKKRESKCFCKNLLENDCATGCLGCVCVTEKEYEYEEEIEEAKRKAACKKLKCVEWITTQQAQHYVLRNAQSSTCDDCDLTLLLEAVPVGNRSEMCCLSTVEEPPFTCCWQEWNPDMDRLYIGYLDADCPLCSIVEVRTMDFAKEYSQNLNESFCHHFNIRSMEFGSCCHSTLYLKMLCDKRDKYPHLHRRRYEFKHYPISYLYFTTAAVMNEEVEKLKSKRGQSSTASSALLSSTAAASTGSSGAPGAPSGVGGAAAGSAGQISSSGSTPSPGPAAVPGGGNGGSGGAQASQNTGQNVTQPAGGASPVASKPTDNCDENGNLVLSPSTEFLVDQKYKTCCFGVATRLFAYYRYVTEMNGCNYCVTDKCDESRQPVHCDCKGGKCSIGCCVKVQFTDEISTQNIANKYRYISIVCFFALCFVMQLILTYIYHSFTSPSSAVYCDFGVHMQSITKGGWKGAIRAQLADPQSEVFTLQHHDTEKGMAKLVQPLELFIPGNVDSFATWVKAQVASVFPEFARVYDLKMYYTACTALCMYTMRKCFEVVEPLIRLHLQRWERRWEKEFACYKESLVGALEKSAHMSRLAQVMRYEMGSFMYNAVPDLPDGAWTALIDEIKLYQWITEHEQRIQKKRRSGDYDSQLTIRQILNKVWRKRLRLIRRLEEQRRAVFHWQGLTDSYEMLKRFYAQQDLAFGVTEEPADDADDFPVGDDLYSDATPHTDTATQSHTETN